MTENPKLTDREKVLNWLDSIGETDQAQIAEVIAQCKANPEARRYYVGRYDAGAGRRSGVE